MAKRKKTKDLRLHCAVTPVCDVTLLATYFFVEDCEHGAKHVSPC